MMFRSNVSFAPSAPSADRFGCFWLSWAIALSAEVPPPSRTF